MAFIRLSCNGLHGAGAVFNNNVRQPSDRICAEGLIRVFVTFIYPLVGEKFLLNTQILQMIRVTLFLLDTMEMAVYNYIRT